MSKPDVAVVGGGPAGSSAAIKCANVGLNVCLIERRRPTISELPNPGETLHPGVEPILRELGVDRDVLAAGFLRHEGNWVKWENEKRFDSFGSDPSGPWLGFQAWRQDFDEILLERAQKNGVRILRSCKAIRPQIEGTRVVGIETSEGSFPCSFLIDAAGSNHWLAGSLGLAIKKYSPLLTAWYGYAQGSCPIRDDAPAIVADNDGWIWTARVQPQIYQWTKLLFERGRVQPRFMPPEFLEHDLVPISGARRADVTWRIVPACAGEGYFMVGDASFVLDPVSSHGVLKALMSGIMAGHLISETIRHEINENLVAASYCQWIYNWFRHDVLRLRELYSKHPWPPSWIRSTSVTDSI